MTDRSYDFTQPASTWSFEITPFGAAIVEALPDRKLKARIARDFKVKAVCPSSLLFNTNEVEAFYLAQGLTIKARQGGVKYGRT